MVSLEIIVERLKLMRVDLRINSRLREVFIGKLKKKKKTVKCEPKHELQN